MKQHEISVKTLNVDALNWLEKLRQVLLIQDRGKGTVKNYTTEMRNVAAQSAKRVKWK